MYKGTIVEESLENAQILKNFKIISSRVTKDANPADRWHIHNVEATREQLLPLSKVIKTSKWYAHFWNEKKEIIAIFRDKVFEFRFDDKNEWTPAIQYGLSVGIPEEQLDFLIP